MKKLVLLFAVFILGFASVTFGVTRYVNQVSGPYYSIQSAINASVAGDIIMVSGGSYVEALTVNVSDLTIIGSGSALTRLRTSGATPGIRLYANNFTLKDIQISNTRQMKEGIRVLPPASQGLHLENVLFLNISNDNLYAYGVKITVPMADVTVKNCQFMATVSSTNAIALYAGYNQFQSNWMVENSTFSYCWVGVYVESSMDGLTVQNNNFGPWDLADCKQSSAGVYVGDGTNGFMINNVTVTGNTFNSFARGVYFLNNDDAGSIGTTTITNNIFTNSIWSSAIRIVAGTHSFGTYGPATLEGPVTVCNNTFTQSAPIVNGSGVAMIDFRTVEGGESPTSSIQVCNNNITFNGAMSLSTWGLLLRGPLTNVDVTGNNFNGNNVGGASPNMPPTSGICVQTNYLDYGPMSGDARYNILNNTITGFTNGISVYDMLYKVYGALPAGAQIETHNNAIFGNTYGVYSGAGERTNARNNWWGDSSGPFHSTNPTGTANAVTDYVDFLPWWCDAAMTTICPQPGPGQAILNVNTGIWYPSTGLGTAFSAALNGHTLFVAPGQVNGARYDFPGKTVDLIGSGIVGQSIITGPGRSLTINNGTLNVGNGLLLNTGNTAAKNIFIDGGNLKLRDCMLFEDPGSYQSAIAVEGTGSLDAGTYDDPGNNLIIVNGPGAAMSNERQATVYALGNDWGSTKGPKINTNPGGNGGEIIGTYKNYVLYDPWRAGPVTVASNVKACVGETSVVIPVKVASFNSVGGLTLLMNYDVNQMINPVLSYQDAAFAAWGNLSANTAIPGAITVSGQGVWPDAGITLPDSTVIFNLTFTLVPGATYSALSFVDATGITCQYIGNSPFYMPFGDLPQATHYINGSMTYDPNPPVPVSVSIVADQNPVEPGDDVTFTATPVNGGSAPSYQWKVNGFNAGTDSPVFTYTPANGDQVKVVMTSNAYCITGNPAQSNTITMYVLDANITVSDTVANGEDNCYDAGQVITVAGPPNAFLVETGGSATFIAGLKILLLEGTTVQAGGYMLAKIAPSGPFCPTPIAYAQPNGNPEPEPIFSADENVIYKAYPNPTSGSFTLVKKGDDIFNRVMMTVATLQGEVVMEKELTGMKSYNFSVDGLAEGLYLIRLISDEKVETIKLIKTR